MATGTNSRVELETLVSMISRGPKPGTRWRHRTGGEYEVIGTAIQESNCSPVVMYRGLGSITWIRPLYEFLDGRFTQITPDQQPATKDGHARDERAHDRPDASGA